ncbi:MAG: hypothetical protein J6B24_04465 [Clostridia bacterium]|nr:hypothetical protein [Clostridia bacterium]
MKFKARNGGKAIAIHNHIRVFRAFAVTLPLCLILTVIVPSLFLSLLLPAGLLLLSFLVLLFEKYDENVFLQGERKDHTFRIEDGLIYKDGKEIKLIRSIRIYRYRGFLYMETSHSMFVIMDTDYTVGSRDELIGWARENGIPVCLGY